MKPILLIVAIAYISLLIGCTYTGGSIDIAGKVLDEYSKEGIPNRAVILQAMIYSDSVLIPTKDIGHFYTDSTGHFTYTINKIKGAYWYNFIFVGDSTYAYSTRMVSLEELKSNSKFQSFYLDKFADLTIKIERINKSEFTDTLFLSWKTNGDDGRMFPYKVINNGTAHLLEFMWIGRNIRSVIEAKTFANKNTIVKMSLFRNRGVKEMSDTIYCIRDVKNSFTFKY